MRTARRDDVLRAGGRCRGRDSGRCRLARPGGRGPPGAGRARAERDAGAAAAGPDPARVDPGARRDAPARRAGVPPPGTRAGGDRAGGGDGDARARAAAVGGRPVAPPGRHRRGGGCVRARSARRPAADTALFNAGTAAIARRDLVSAKKWLTDASRSLDPGLRFRALYNLGLVALLESRRDTTKRRGARGGGRRSSFREALLLPPASREAKWNLELVQERAPPPSGAGWRAHPRPPPPPAPPNPRPRGGSASPSPKRSRSSIRWSGPSATCAPNRRAAAGWRRARRQGLVMLALLAPLLVQAAMLDVSARRWTATGSPSVSR